jgi:hypothetical protein
MSWPAADISSIILRSRHAGAALSPPNTPTKPGSTHSFSTSRFGPPAAQPQPPAHASLQRDVTLHSFRPIAASSHSTHEHFPPPPPAHRHSETQSEQLSRDRRSPPLAQHAPAIHQPRIAPPSRASTITAAPGPNFAFPPSRSSGRPGTFQDAEDAFIGGLSGSGVAERQALHATSPSTQRAFAAENGAFDLEGDDDVAAQQVLHSLRSQVISNEVELLRQRLAVANLELHNRSKDYELLQRAVAAAESRAEAAERCLADMQRPVQSWTRIASHVDASTSTPLEQPLCAVENYGSSKVIDASTQTLADSDLDTNNTAVLQRLIATQLRPVISSSISPPKYSSQKHSVLLDNVNAKADHLAEKLEELLFNMSVQQREFSNLSRIASSLFRTLVQTLHAVAHCYAILSGGHDEQVRRRRYMMIEREIEGRDVAVFASEACVLIDDAIEAVNLVNMLRAPPMVHKGDI